jgi:hypothetical protein
MALAALIAAVRDAEDGSGLVGILPVAGRTLIERQARLAALAGADRVVILIERLPPGLTAAIDRLRKDGIAVDVARSAGDAADRFHPDERVLVFADGAIAGAESIARLVAGPAPALLTLGESGPPGPFERIDAGNRWAGLALVSGELLRKTVAMLGDWDLHSTLLRRAVGASARRIDVADGAGLGEAVPPVLVRSRGGARLVTDASFDAERPAEGWPARFVYRPLARIAAGLLLDKPIEADWLRIGGLGAAVVAIPASGKGWIAAALLLLVLGALLDATGRLIGALRLAPAGTIDRLGVARTAAAGFALLALAWHRDEGALASPLLALATVAVMAGLAREKAAWRLAARDAALPLWIADADALVLLFAPFALAAQCFVGLAALAVYASSSFGLVQSRLLRVLRG